MRDIADIIVQQAITAIDSGKTAELMELIDLHPDLVVDRLQNNDDGYFKNPYLLWFVADNPIRTDQLRHNILDVTRSLLQVAKNKAPDTYKYQVDYTLSLVASGRVPRDCGVQIAMIDLLIDAGASPNAAMVALANGNLDAAQHLVDRGDNLTLAIAVCLEGKDDINHLAALASEDEKLTALATAAFYGKANMVRRLLETGVNPNGFPKDNSGFHSHATPLHQAVSSGSLDTVKLLVEAGASLYAADKIYNGTPQGWAAYLQSDDSNDESGKRNFGLIKKFLYTSEEAH
ncbi:ankyrin repeat domain-containing protein [Mucilaginibacter sp. UR6-11]|uniref:ankyrin repeat domain-containing protein n=1 Tax=Mucilaginibacter sp. UR6-11 TaxID=1435644 RepID=UPI001E34A464|nr:ankyrin repeat domain-containing protein [Mucilaginibacter sp. UR6-11]MCC8426701.1 ankyrin repeat domain-containing protein [Mucilaginibacter sp. UR6-11]